ncbi:MAG: tetratricopeptide repeat protein [bacterium]
MKRLIAPAVMLLLVLSALFTGGKNIGPPTFIQIVIIVIAIFYLVSLKKRKDTIVVLAETAVRKMFLLDYLICSFLVVLAFSAIRSVYLYASLREIFKGVSYIILYYVVYDTISSDKMKNMLMQTIIATGVLLSVIIIAQYIKGVSAIATFPNANLAAGYIVIGMLLALVSLVIKVRQAGNIKESFTGIVVSLSVCVVLIGVMLWAVLITRSRGAMLGFTVALLILSWLLFRKKGVLSVIAAILAMLLIIPKTYTIRLFKLMSLDPYAFKRLAIWKGGLKAMLDRPLLGWGPGASESIFYRYNFPVEGPISRFGKVAQFAHNEFIQLGLEAGVIALVLIIAIITVVVVRGFREASCAIKETESSPQEKLGILGPTVGLFAIITHSLVDFTLHLPAISILLVLFAAMIMNREKTQRVFRGTPWIGPKNAIVGIIFLLGFCVLVGMPYIAHLYGTHQDYETAVKFNPLYSPYHAALGDIYAHKFSDARDEKWKNIAVGEYEKAISANSENPYHYQQSADFYYNKLRDINKSLSLYKEAIKRAPYDASLYFYMASIYFNEKKFDKAIEIYREALNLEPNYLNAHYYLGRSYEALGKEEKALTQYIIIITISEMDLLEKAGYTPLEYDRELLSFDVSHVYNRLGLLSASHKQTDNAIDYYKKALKINPSYAEVYSNLAGAYYQKGLYALAANECKKALKIEPKNEMFMKNLEKSIEKLGK